MIAVIFSCAGMLGALWAEDFGMLSIWNIYLIIPLVLLGGVFHPIAMLPEPVQILSQFNPMFYLVQGIRFSVTGMIQTSLVSCILVALIMALFSFYMAVYLFKIGYKLRT
jgi:ABC-2 type transport system permease protein